MPIETPSLEILGDYFYKIKPDNGFYPDGLENYFGGPVSVYMGFKTNNAKKGDYLATFPKAEPLYVRTTDLSRIQQTGVAVVGSRETPDEARLVCAEIGRTIVDCRLSLNSGMAPTADTWTARGALENNGIVNAITHKGLERWSDIEATDEGDEKVLIPREWDQIVLKGSIVSENNVQPKGREIPYSKFTRNRITLAISGCLVLVYGDELNSKGDGPSSTLTTVALAASLAQKYGNMQIGVVDWSKTEGITMPSLNKRILEAKLGRCLRANHITEDLTKMLHNEPQE